MSRWKLLSALLPVAAALVSSGSCGDTPTVASYDRAALLHEVAEQVIVPGYTALHQDAQGLVDAERALCAQASEDTLGAAREAWKKVFLSWQRSAAYGFGPATDDNLGPEMAFWPAKPENIEAEITGQGAIDAGAIDALGGAAKGLYALEYLLFGPHGNAADLADARRCAYGMALGDHVQRTTDTLLNAWSAPSGGFAQTLATAGESGNAVYPAQLSAVSALVTGVVTVVENVKDAKLGAPLGLTAMSKGANPGAVECAYAPCSVAAMQASMEGIRSVWKQTEHNFDAYLRSRDAKLADQVLAQLAAVDADLAALPEPLAGYATGADLSLGKAAYADLDALERLFTTDVDVAFAVNLMFNSNDGD